MNHQWRTSRRSVNNGACVEAGNGPGTVLVRDTKQEDTPGRAVLAFSPNAWRTFAATVKQGDISSSMK